MLKLIKIFFVLIAFVLIALLTIPFFADVNDYKSEIKNAVYDATGRNLDIGTVKLSLFPWIGITLTDIKLENAEGFAQPNILEAKSIDIQVALMPLFDQQVKVKRFELNAPKVWLTKNKDGSNNWSGLQPEGVANTDNETQADLKPQKTEAPTTETESLPVVFEAKLLQLSDGQVFWDDKTKRPLHIDDIQLKITDLQLQQPIGIDLSASVAGNPIQMAAEIGPVLDVDKFNVEKLPALINIKSSNFNLKPFAAWLPKLEAEQESQFGKLADAHVSLDISVEQHSDKTMLSSGSIQVQAKQKLGTSWKVNMKSLHTLKIESFKLDVDDSNILNITGKVRSFQKKPKFEVKVTTSTLQRIWLNKFIPALESVYKEHPKPWQTVKLEAFLAGDTDIVEIRNMLLTLNDEPVQISGDIAIGDAPDIQLRITADTLHLDPWIPQSNDEESKATVSAGNATLATPTTEIEPDLTFLKPWYLSVQLQANTIHAMELKLEKLRMTLSSEKGVVRLNPLSFNINGGHIAENMTVYANQYPATWKQALSMKGVSIQPILKTLADFHKLSGIATLSANISGKGLLPDNIIHSMSGRGDFLLENGKFKGVDIAKSARKLQRKDNLEQSTDFAQMQGTFHIKNAILTNKDLYMASPLFRMSGKGKVYFDPAKLDYRVRPRLVQTLAGQGGTQTKKGVTVPLHITGPFDNLNVAISMDKKAILDSAAALNNATGNKIGGVAGQVLDKGFVKTREEQKKKAVEKARLKAAAAKKRAEDKAKQKAKDKLKDVFKGFKF